MKLNKTFTLLLLGISLSGATYAQTVSNTSFTPLELSGWTEDGIAETRPAATSSGNIQTNGWAYYTSAIQTDGAIAGDDRMLTSASGVAYKFAPYNFMNMTVVSSWIRQKVVLTLNQPVATDELSFLGTGVAGKGIISVVVVYTDGTRSTATNIELLSWDNKTGAAKTGLGRIKRNTGSGFQADHIPTAHTYTLSESKLATDKSKQILQLELKDNNSIGYALLMAVSAKTEGIGTGITQNIRQEARRPIAIYNINGVKLSAPTKGVNILRYADGTSRKVVVNE